MTKEKVIPQIRFSGFTDTWEQRKLSDTLNFLSNNTLSRAELSEDTGTYKNVHYGDVLIKFGEYIDAQSTDLPYIADDEKAKKFESSKLQDGDIIIADTAEDEAVGKCVEIGNIGDLSIVSGLHTIPCRSKVKFAPAYLGFYLNSSSYHDQLIPLMQGIKVTSISKSAISDTLISAPTDLSEQGKIGQFFSQLDTLITLHQRKYDKLTKVKKAMLEKMFPKNGSLYPEIRFKGFTDAWEQRKLGEVADIVGGGTPSTSNDDYWDGDIDWYAPAEIADQIYVASSERKITQQGYDNSSAKMLPVGTVLFTSRAGIGKTAILRKEGCTNQGFQSIVPHINELDSYFIFSRSEEMKRYGETVGAGSTFVEVSGKQMANMELMMPITMEEQVTIGSFFSNLDFLITLHQRKLEKLKNIKKACLEKMFV